MSIAQLLQRPIAFHRCFVDLGVGITGAVMLSQAFYWSSRTKDREGWFYKTQEEWTEETGMTRYEQETARKKLRDAGILEEKKKGIPSKLYYRINMKNLEDALHRCMRKSRNLKSDDSADSDVENQPCNTETTTETTNKDLEKRRGAHEEATPEQLNNLFSPQAPEPQSRFRIQLNWRPDRDKLEPYCMNAGCPTTARPDQLIDGIIGEWVNIWHSDGGANSEAKWLSLLAGFIKRKLADHDSGGWNKQTKPRSYGVPQRNQDFESIDHREGGAELGLEVI